MGKRVKEKRKRNLDITRRMVEFLREDEDNTVNAIALKLAYEYDLTPERIKVIYKKYRVEVDKQ